MSDVVYVPPDPGEAVDNDDVAVSNSVEVLLEANPFRTSALIVNIGDGDIRVTTDGTDPTPTHGKPVPAGGGTLSLASPNCPQNVVKAIRQGTVDSVVNASEVN